MLAHAAASRSPRLAAEGEITVCFSDGLRASVVKKSLLRSSVGYGGRRSEVEVEAGEGGEAGHGVAAVYGVAGVGDVLEAGEEGEVAADVPCQFEVEKGVILIFDVGGDVEPSDSFEISVDMQKIPGFPLHAEIILVAWRAYEIGQRGVKIAVGRRQPEVVRGMAVGSQFNALVYETAGVLVLLVDGLNHIAAIAVIACDFGREIA